MCKKWRSTPPPASNRLAVVHPLGKGCPRPPMLRGKWDANRGQDILPKRITILHWIHPSFFDGIGAL